MRLVWRARCSSSETSWCGGRGEAEVHMVSRTETSVAHPSHPVPGKEKRRRRKSGAVWNIHFGRRKEGECGTAAVQLVVGSRVCFLKGNASADREGFPSSFPPTQSLKKEKKKRIFLFLPFPLWKQRTLRSTPLSSRRETAWRQYLEVRFNHRNNPVDYDTRVGGNDMDRVAFDHRPSWWRGMRFRERQQRYQRIWWAIRNSQLES